MTLRAVSGERELGAAWAGEGEPAGLRSCGARLAWRTRCGRPFSVSVRGEPPVVRSTWCGTPNAAGSGIPGLPNACNGSVTALGRRRGTPGRMAAGGPGGEVGCAPDTRAALTHGPGPLVQRTLR